MINGVLPRDERNTVRGQKSFIVNKLLEDKCTNYINIDIHHLRPDGDWIRENGHLDKPLFYKDNLHHIEREYFKLALSIKEKSILSKIILPIQTTSRKNKHNLSFYGEMAEITFMKIDQNYSKYIFNKSISQNLQPIRNNESNIKYC